MVHAIATAVHGGVTSCHPDEYRNFTTNHQVNIKYIEQLIPTAKWDPRERRALGLAVLATLAAPASLAQADEITELAAGLSDLDLVSEVAGVAFAFNTINRIADARQVRLEYRWLRDLWPVRAWVERGFSSLTGLIYDLSFVHKSGHEVEEVLGWINAFSRELGGGTPALFDRLRDQPAVLEGMSTLLLVNARDSGISRDLWVQAAAISVTSRSTPGSSLRPMIDAWLSRSSPCDANSLLSRAISGDPPDDSRSLCLRYAWQVANAAHVITDDDLRRLRKAGISDPELLDVAIVASIFAALSAIEPLVAAAGRDSLAPSVP